MSVQSVQTMDRLATPTRDLWPELSEPQTMGPWHLRVAWTSLKVDGRIDAEQWKALKAVEELFDVQNSSEPPCTGSELIERLGDASRTWSDKTKYQLFCTACWVTFSDLRTHGTEAWLLCELRRVFGLDPDVGRRAMERVRKLRRSADGPPSPDELYEVYGPGELSFPQFVRTRAPVCTSSRPDQLTSSD